MFKFSISNHSVPLFVNREGIKTGKSVFWLLAVFIGPLCLNLAAFKLPVEVIFFDYIFAVGLIFSTVLKRRRRFHGVIRLFKWVCVLYIAIGFANVLREGKGIMFFTFRHYGVVIALGIVYYFENLSGSRNVRQIIIRFANFTGLIFLFQLVYSLYESVVSSDFLVNSYDWNGAAGVYEYPASELVDRLQTEYFFSSLHIPFRIVFSGILGQHNHWGTQLPFYFLLFGYIYFSGFCTNKRFLVLMGLVAIAAIFNTSRFSIIAIAITGIYFFFKLSTFSPLLKKMTIIGVLVIVALYIGHISDTISEYISLTDTFSIRVDTWSVISRFVFERDIFSILFGSTAKGILSMSTLLVWRDFENLMFTLIFERGFIYFFLFVTFLVIVFKKSISLNRPEKILARLLVLNIIFVSLWSNVVFRYTSFGLVSFMICLAFFPRKKLDIR